MMEYRAVKERQDEIRRSVERWRMVMDARVTGEPHRSLRLAVGTGLARLGLRLAGPTAIRTALGKAR